MKKKSVSNGSLARYYLKKLCLMMRLMTFVILVSVFVTQANTVSSQSTRITLELKNASLIEILEQVEQQLDIGFLLPSNLLKDDRNINLSVKDETIESTLKQILTPNGYNYEFVGKNVVITGKGDTQQANTSKDVKGKVIDSSGQSLPGVSIVIKGTTTGTITDFEGNYTLSGVSGKATLVFSFVGMVSQEVVVGNQNVINITLEEDAVSIEEVIAVGYQTKQKTNLTGSVSTVSAEQLENRPTPRLTDILDGLAPGLNITRTNAGKLGGGGVSIDIGGIASRSDAGVLVVIDGIPQIGTNTPLNNVNPNDIESISVLKDAEAVIYGARASGGVLVITTKKGKEPKISGQVSATFKTPKYYARRANMYDYFHAMNDYYEEVGQGPISNWQKVFDFMIDNNITREDVLSNEGKYEITDGAQFGADTPYLRFGHTNWSETFYGSAITKNYNVTASGATDQVNYYVSAGIVDDEGMLRYGTNTQDTYFARLKMEYNHKDYLTIGANINLRHTKTEEPSEIDNAQFWAGIRATYDHPYTKEGRYMSMYTSWYNPIGLVEEGGDRELKSYDIQPQFYVDFKPFRNMIISGRVSQNLGIFNRKELFRSVNFYNGNEGWYDWSRRPEHNVYSTRRYTGNTTIANVQASYKVAVNDDHTIRSLVGASHEEFHQEWVDAWRRNLVSDRLHTLRLGDSEEQYNNDLAEQWALKSYYANLSYSYKDRYVVEGNMRYDGSSRFIEGQKWEDFYGAGISWNISNEPFFKSLNLRSIDFFKFRGTWGQMGNQVGGIGLYDFAPTITIANSSYIMGAPGSYYTIQRARSNGFPAVDRTWETAEKLNFGYDIEMLNNRLTSSFNYSVTNTRNMFYREEFPSVLGTSPPSINGAHVEVKGWDFTIKWQDQIGELKYFASFNISDNKSMVKALADARIPAFGKPNPDWNQHFIEGFAPYTIFGFEYDGIIANEQELAEYYENVTAGISSKLRVGDVRYKDLDGDGVLERSLYKEDENGNPTADSGDAVDVGTETPHYFYNINLGASWKGFDFSILLTGIGQWYKWDQTPNQWSFPWRQPMDHYLGNTWTAENPDAFYPRYHSNSNAVGFDMVNNNYNTISNAPYLKQNVPYLAIRNVKIGYTLPKTWANKVKTDKLYLYVSGNDLGYIVNKMPGKSFSPSQPFETNLTPYPYSVSIGLDVNF